MGSNKVCEAQCVICVSITSCAEPLHCHSQTAPLLLLPAVLATHPAAGAASGSAQGLVLGAFACAYALGLLLIIYLIVRRVFWSMGDFELRYGKVEVQAEDAQGRRLLFAALQRLRWDGAWMGGEQEVLVQQGRLEPGRTQHYLSTGVLSQGDGEAFGAGEDAFCVLLLCTDQHTGYTCCSVAAGCMRRRHCCHLLVALST